MIHKDTDLPAGTADLRDGQVVKGDGVTLLAVHTPGHASDHLCFYLEEERALFSGDLILNGSTSVIPDEDGDLADYMASLRRVQALGVRRIYPAHGPVIEDAPAKIQEYIDHRMDRERQILDTLGNGARTIPEMVKVIYADVPRSTGWRASVHSHLEAKRRRVAEDGTAVLRWTSQLPARRSRAADQRAIHTMDAAAPSWTLDPRGPRLRGPAR
jgi:glyoxylase-like metal-dependent hydrolase (beta-lactamase superfamily II)